MPGPFYEIDGFTPQNQGEAACSFCNQHAREKLVDLPDGTRELRRARTFRTPLYIHMEGHVEICEWCAEELGIAIGMIRATEAEQIKDRADDLDAEGQQLRDRLSESDRMVTSLAGELARAAEGQAAKVKTAYDRGYAQAQADAKLELADAES